MNRSMQVLMAGVVLLLGGPAVWGQGIATPVDKIRLPEGFSVELLYSVPRDVQGSWVAMCEDDKGRLIVSDQYGGLFRFKVPGAGETLTEADIEQIAYGITTKDQDAGGAAGFDPSLPVVGFAQGLCYAFDSLYVSVNSRSSSTGSGVFRLLDTDGDDRFDKMVTIQALAGGGGEHGPHAILPSPDGKSLYVVMGNETALPEDYTHSRVPELWAEDQLLPSLQYFMAGVEAPRGHIAKFDPEGKTWEIIATGFRNQYDAAFNRAGELFTYDADMEWDLNTPWYRPTRINHVIDGADYGWRTGSGKFPAYSSDTFGASVDIGPGSPTGVTFGYGAKFPAKYQNALFACDWSYGKLYAVHLEPKGSTYTATFEEFAGAQPLPIADILIGSTDGAMYLTVGGRRVQSGLYRVTYTGSESTAPVKAAKDGAGARKQRHALEAFVQKGAKPAGPKSLDLIWQSLGSSDRGIRHAARVALEKQKVEKWSGRLAGEKDPVIVTAALIAMARVDGVNSSTAMIERVMAFDYEALESQQTRLDVVRALTLALTRGGMPDPILGFKLIKWLDGIYPASTWEENRDLAAVMAFVQAPSAAKKGMDLLLNASGQEAQIAYAMNLRLLKYGWTAELRAAYFEWFVRAGSYQGGARFLNYLKGMKDNAVASVPDVEKTEKLVAIINTKPKETGPVFTSEARSFVKMWAMSDATELIGNGIEGGRDFENGRQMFGAGACYVCHRFNNQGGAVGPDLTAAGGKFGPHDLLEAIVDPGKEISDQYGASVFTLTDGSQLIGRIMNMRDEYWINTDMMTPSTVTKVKMNLVESIEPSEISMMPPGLLATMTKDDILDLLAYLISAGDEEHELFGK